MRKNLLKEEKYMVEERDRFMKGEKIYANWENVVGSKDA